MRELLSPALVSAESGERKEPGDWDKGLGTMRTKPSKYLGVRLMPLAHATSLPCPQIPIPATLKAILKHP